MQAEVREVGDVRVTLEVILQILLRLGREAADGALRLAVTNLDLVDKSGTFEHGQSKVRCK